MSVEHTVIHLMIHTHSHELTAQVKIIYMDFFFYGEQMANGEYGDNIFFFIVNNNTFWDVRLCYTLLYSVTHPIRWVDIRL